MGPPGGDDGLGHGGGDFQKSPKVQIGDGGGAGAEGILAASHQAQGSHTGSLSSQGAGGPEVTKPPRYPQGHPTSGYL